jgi:hypothetical protein
MTAITDNGSSMNMLIRFRSAQANCAIGCLVFDMNRKAFYY